MKLATYQHAAAKLKTP